MNETRPATDDPAAADIDLRLQSRLDALVRGEGTEDEFVKEVASLLHEAPNSAWHIVAGIQQRYRHGEISADLFRDIASKIVGFELASAHGNTTTDLQAPVAKHLSGSTDAQWSESPVEIGRVLRDRYVIEERLGSGGMGTVFKALDRYRSDLPQASQYVAIKILHDTADNRPERLANLRREFYCTQMLSHRNIVKVYELDRDGDLDFFTMEWLEGELLSSVTERLHPQPMLRPYAWKIIREIGSGLAHAHARSVVHSDLKPHNIMLTNSGEVRILDFGASSAPTRQSPEATSRRRNVLSAVTPAYACCELLAGRPADPRDDIYSFACLSYELLAGTHPFQRRPSTVARDLGIVPKRPPGLNWQQWKALEMGLSWHRGGRSISVRAWVDKLNTDRGTAKQLPPARDLEPAPPPNARPAAFMRATTLFTVLLITSAIWVLFIRPAPGGRVSGNDATPAIAVNKHLEAGRIATLDGPRQDRKPPADSGLVETSPRVSPNTPPEPADTRAPPLNNVRPDAKRSRLSTALLSPIVVSASNYRIRSGEHFAEIRVHRTSRLRTDTPFVWWTEGASAKPGIDYVHQGKVTQSFPKGKNSTSFFIKLVPEASRAQTEVFYIAVAEAGLGTTTGQVARAAVWLPSTQLPSTQPSTTQPPSTQLSSTHDDRM
jgi:serine/threonine protein kinase